MAIGSRLDWAAVAGVRAGREAWLAVADGGPAGRARAAPEWLVPELVSTPPAADKLKCWLRQSPAWPARRDPAAVLTQQRLFGDEALSHLVARCLAERIPAPVCDYVVEHATIVAVGVQTIGFCSPPIARAGRPWQIFLSSFAEEDPHRFLGLVAHEVAHPFLLDEPGEDEWLETTAFWTETVERMPIENVPPEARPACQALRQRMSQYETECRQLTRAWGFEDR